METLGNRSSVLVEKPYAYRLACEIESSPGQLPADDVAVRHVKTGVFRAKASSLTCRSDGAVVMTMALSYDISHQRTATAAVKVLPAPVTGSDCDLLMAGKGEEDFALFLPRLDVEDTLGELVWVRSE